MVGVSRRKRGDGIGVTAQGREHQVHIADHHTQIGVLRGVRLARRGVIPQLVDVSTTERRTSLPAFTFLGSEETHGGGLDLPWAAERTFAVGEFARRQAADAPQQTVGAAKSWLCYSRVDRRQAILPWNASDDIGKISPVTAARNYLDHLVAAWEAEFPDAP